MNMFILCFGLLSMKTTNEKNCNKILNAISFDFFFCTQNKSPLPYTCIVCDKNRIKTTVNNLSNYMPKLNRKPSKNRSKNNGKLWIIKVDGEFCASLRLRRRRSEICCECITLLRVCVEYRLNTSWVPTANQISIHIMIIISCYYYEFIIMSAV